MQSHIVTLKDVAARCGVSFKTVARALNHDKGVSAANAERIRATATEMGYDPSRHHLARRMVLLKQHKRLLSQTLALFFPSDFYRAQYFMTIFQGILHALDEAGYGLVTYFTYQDQQKNALPALFRRGDIDGVIVLEDPHRVQPLLDQLRADIELASCPVVSLFHPLPDCFAVLTDDYGGAYAATEHLMTLGHRTIAPFWDPASCHEYQQRMLGCRQAACDQGCDPETTLRFISPYSCQQTPWEEVLAQEVRTTIRQQPDITAIIAANDPEALTIIDTLSRLGIRVPEDVSVIGFDDTDVLLDTQGCNRLTSIRLPLEDVGRQAAQRLLRYLQGDMVAMTAKPLPTSLIIRATTAPPRAVQYLRVQGD